jgi:hypothetical protein
VPTCLSSASDDDVGGSTARSVASGASHETPRLAPEELLVKRLRNRLAHASELASPKATKKPERREPCESAMQSCVLIRRLRSSRPVMAE